MKTAENLRVRRMVLCALFAALTAVCSQIAIPMPWGVPINLALFAVYMAGTMLGAFWGTVSQLVFVALAAIGEVFETCTAMWRGLGPIEGSGYRIRPAFERYDAVKRFRPEVEPTQDPKGCRCGDVLRGIMPPSDCPLFRTVCTPENPVGPCMVSSEGSCAAYYRYY